MSDIDDPSSSALPDDAVVRAGELSALGAVEHAFFTRDGGISTGIYRGLNAGIGSNDDPAAVAANRSRAGATLGLSSDRIATPWQVHSAEAIVVEAPFDGARPKVDAVVTRTPGLAVGIVTADCGPVLFADASNGVVAAAHSGWRGALGGVLAATVATMESVGAKRSSIVAVLGPTITSANYEVGVEMMAEVTKDDAARERFFQPGRSPDKRQFDLPAFIVAQLEASGVAASFTGHCTYGAPDRFFSYRRTTHQGEPDYGRQLSAIVLKG